MKADLTRSTFQPDQHYRAVRMQQGRVQTDADWNEQQDILNRRIETETVDTVGTEGCPVDHAGFQLNANGKNIDIGAGRYYVNGLLCELSGPVTAITQPQLPGQASPILPTGATQLPLPPGGAAKLTQIQIYNNNGQAVDPEDGIYLGYLEAWLRHVTALEDPLIREVALGGPDTATRDQLVWQVKLVRAGNLGSNVDCSTAHPWTDLTALPDGKLAARSKPSVPPKDPCLLAPEAGFRRLENLLYRVEIHDDGTAPGKLRYKWSRDNGSIATRVTRWLGNPVANEFEVASVGRDAYLAITAGCWLEFYDDVHDLLGRAGTLVQVLKTAGNVVTVDLATKTGPLDQALFASSPRVRRWDGWADMAPAAANAAAGWVELEDGVEIKFIPGKYRVGDYWTIPARTATADVEWPRDGGKPIFLAPQGILRAFARLAVLSCQAGTWTKLSDCRHLFPALTELTNLYYVGGDGQEVMPNPLAPQPLALASSLEVAVFNGEFPVFGAQVRFTSSQGLLPNGTNSQIVPTGADGVAQIVWRLAPNVVNQTCSAELLEAGQPIPGKYNDIHFSARLAVAAQIAYDPSACTELAAQGANTVQAALDILCRRNHGGCCVTVGQDGEFPNLDTAVQTLLKKKVRYICLCLLPGEHRLKDTIEEVAPEGTHLLIHGAGSASRLIMRGEKFHLTDFASVTLKDFDIYAFADNLSLQLESCEQVACRSMNLGGFTVPGASLLQVKDSMLIGVSGVQIYAVQPDGLKRIKELLVKLPLFKAIEPALRPEQGALFAPVPAEVAKAFTEFTGAQRKSLANQVDTVLREPPEALRLGGEEVQALQGMSSAIIQARGQQVIALMIDRLRKAFLDWGYALALSGADAETLLTDSGINGRLSLYGESTEDPAINDQFAKELGGGMNSGAIRLLPGNGELRLRNNRLREIRLGDGMLETLKQALATGNGEIRGYNSLVADANTLTGPEGEFLAFDLALAQNALRPQTDVGVAIARQGNYIGNFAHDDFRLFIVGHRKQGQAFGNGGLNIVEI